MGLFQLVYHDRFAHVNLAGRQSTMTNPDLKYPYADHPAPGTTREVADGVRWLTMPMGGSLTHINLYLLCLLYTSPSPRDKRQSRMPSSA